MRWLFLFLLLPCSAFAEVLLTDSFDSGSVDAAWTGLSVTAAHYTPNTAETTFVNSPTHSGAKSLHYYALVGTNEITPIQLDLEQAEFEALFGGEADELYVEWHEYFTGTYPWPTSSQKLLRIYFNNGVTAERKEYNLFVQTSGTDVNIQYFCGFGVTTNCNVDEAQYSGVAHEEDQWVKWGYWLKLNTPGSSDGFIKVYKNDALFIDTGNVDLRGTNTSGVHALWIGGNYSMLAAGTLASSGSRYIDDVTIYTTQPSAGGVRKCRTMMMGVGG